MELREEFSIKLGRIRSLMADKKLDAVFLKRQDDFAWLSCGGRNYVGAGDMGNCGLLVTEDRCYAITNNIEAPRMLEEENIGELGFEMRAGVWHDTAFEENEISSIVKSGNIGKDFGPGNIAEDIKLIRMDLTEAEVERYISNGKNASEAIERAAMTISKGDSEYSIAARIISNMEDYGLEMISCMVASDERIRNYRHPLPTARKAEGLVQIGGNFRRKGLVVCMTRYVALSPLSNSLRKQYHDNQIIDGTYIAASKPGSAYSEALLAGKMMYEELGYGEEFDKHHQGGPIGYAGRDYRVNFSTNGKIQEHQGFCWNPSITGTKSEDTCIVTKDSVTMVTGPVLFPKAEISAGGVTLTRPAILER